MLEADQTKQSNWSLLEFRRFVRTIVVIESWIVSWVLSHLNVIVKMLTASCLNVAKTCNAHSRTKEMKDKAILSGVEAEVDVS